MKNIKLIYFVFLFGLMFMLSGCKGTASVDNGLTTLPSPTSAISEAPTITQSSIAPTTVPTVTPIITLDLTQDELSMEAYEKFMKNEAKISFDRYMQYDYRERALYNKGNEYTLSEVLAIVTEFYFEDSTNDKIKYIDYSYIDCGKDGVKELVLRFNGMDIYCIDDASTLVYIIKYIDGKLYLCYYYETWARSDSTINEYGYFESGGSSGASNHGSSSGLIDKDGNWQFIVYVESETDISQLSWLEELGQLPKVAETKEISGEIELVTLHFNEYVYNSNEADNEEYYYTFYVYDDNWDLIEDSNLYTNSIYKDVFDEVKVPFITPDEASIMISEKSKKVGVTDEIRNGKEITWKILSENVFSDYVDLDNDICNDATYEIYTCLHESMPEYRFVATGLLSGMDIELVGYVIGLEVYNENNVLILSEDFSESYDDMIIGHPVYNEMMDTMGLHVVDVNFDGYKDVIILNNFAGAHGNTWYDCWLWDVNTSSFVASDSFAEICNPALDSVNECIYSAGGSGAAYWGGKIYKFINGEFVVTNELDTYWDGLVETKLTNGKMEIVREVIYGEDDQIVMNEMEYYKNDELWQLDQPHWYWVGGHHADKWLE